MKKLLTDTFTAQLKPTLQPCQMSSLLTDKSSTSQSTCPGVKLQMRVLFFMYGPMAQTSCSIRQHKLETAVSTWWGSFEVGSYKTQQQFAEIPSSAAACRSLDHRHLTGHLFLDCSVGSILQVQYQWATSQEWCNGSNRPTQRRP